MGHVPGQAGDRRRGVQFCRAHGEVRSGRDDVVRAGKGPRRRRRAGVGGEIRDRSHEHCPAGSPCFNADAVYFGSLPARNPGSVTRASLKALLERGNYRELFFDINIRKQNYTADLLDLALSHATIFKLSRDERAVLDIDADPDNHKFFCRAICRRYPNIRLVLLTLDKDGSKVYDARADKILRIRCSKAKVVSTVGAGDSFSACFLYNYLSGEPVEVCLKRATALADYVVGHLGAIPDYTPELVNKIRPLA